MSQVPHGLLALVVAFLCAASSITAKSAYRRHHHHNVPPPSKLPLHPNYQPSAISPHLDVHLEKAAPCIGGDVIIKDHGPVGVAGIGRPCVQTVSVPRAPAVAHVQVAVPQPPAVHHVPVSVARPPVIQNVAVQVPRPPIVGTAAVAAAPSPCARLPVGPPIGVGGLTIQDNIHDGLEGIAYGKGFGDENDHTHDPPGTVTIALPDATFSPKGGKTDFPDFQIPAEATPAAVAAANAAKVEAPLTPAAVPAANKHHVHKPKA